MYGRRKRWKELRGEFLGLIGIRWWVVERSWWEFLEMDVSYCGRVPAVDPELGLADVGGGADVVDGDAGGGYEAGEVEKLVEVALRRQRHHHHRDLRFFMIAIFLAVIGH